MRRPDGYDWGDGRTILRNVLRAAPPAIAALGLVLSVPARAQQDYPHDVVTLITHSSPGGGSDVFLRQIAGHLGDAMGVSFVVMNVRGGSGARAMARLGNAPPDGSILYATTPTYIYTSLLSRPGTTFRDLEPVVNVFFDEEVVYTRADGPFETLADVIDVARNERGRWGAANPASLERQALERLKTAAGVTPAIVTYEGGGELALNVLNGTLDIGVGEAIELESQIEAGTLRLLAVFSAERAAAFPDVPTTRESGYDVVVSKFRGFAAPKGLSSELISAWEDGVQRLLADPQYRQTTALLSPAFMGHAEYVEFIDEFAAETEDYLRESGALR